MGSMIPREMMTIMKYEEILFSTANNTLTSRNLSKQCRPAQTPRFAASDSGLHCLPMAPDTVM